MPNIDFSAFNYYPSLLSNTAEHLGYRRLSKGDKNNLLPIFELSHRRNASDFGAAIDLIQESAGQRPFILDLEKTQAPPPYISKKPKDPKQDKVRFEKELQAQQNYNAALKELLKPDDGFLNWRSLSAKFPTAAIALQFTNATSQGKHVLQQATELLEDGKSLVIRIGLDSTGDQALAAKLISHIPDPSLLLIVVDCQQGRTHLPKRASFAQAAIQNILSNIEAKKRSKIRAVCMSNSFMKPGHEGLRDYANLDRKLFSKAKEVFPFVFGDYSSMHRFHPRNNYMPPDWLASVALPTNDSWLLYRHKNLNDKEGWIKGAEKILQHAHFKSAPDVWGTDLIREAAKGNIEGVDSARFWSAARVNIHLHRQIALG